MMQKTQETNAPVARPLLRQPGQHRSEVSRSWRRFRRYRPGIAGLIFILILIVLATAAPLVAPYPPNAITTARIGEGPSLAHPFGFDELGRDVLSRMIYGARAALLIGILATGLAVCIGTMVGSLSGYFGGWVDALLSRVVDTLMAFPILILLLTLSAVFGPGLKTVILILGATLWATYARVVRADVLSLREREYVLAARAAGATGMRITLRHILPNVLGPVIVIATLSVGLVIIISAALSFLGLGVPPPAASWGGDLSSARVNMQYYPHTAIVPGTMITLTVLAFNLVGDGLRDALDPRSK